MADQPERRECSTNRSPSSNNYDATKAATSSDELLGWLHTLDPSPTHHHVVNVVQEPAPGHGNQIVLLRAACACGWRWGGHQVYLGATTTWAQERARQQLEDAGVAHIRSLEQS